MNKIAIASMSLTAAFAFSLAACAEMHYAQPISEPAASQSAAEVQIPNPWQDAPSMQDAQNLAGFTLTGPETLHEMNQCAIRVLPDADMPIVEIRYGEDAGEAYAAIRKTTANEDVSGVYTEYPAAKEVMADTTTVSAKGNGETYETADWSKSGCRYSLYVSSGISEEELVQAVAMVN